MQSEFHLSIGVKSIEESEKFFVDVMEGRVLHRDASGYVNIDLFGSQITLKHNTTIMPNLPDFHFGVNLTPDQFDRISSKILDNWSKHVIKAPHICDENTPMERKKMYLKRDSQVFEMAKL